MVILDLVESEVVGTQEELVDALRARGENVTQATVSRDIKDLRLVKATDSQGNHRYTQDVMPSQDITDRLLRVFRDSVLSVQRAHNIILFKTLSGSANAACEAVDALQWADILGTVAGDNTIMVVLREEADPKAVMENFQMLLH